MSIDQASIDRLMHHASKAVTKEWKGTERALGLRIQRALLAEEVLRLLALQDEDEVADSVVRELAIGGWLKVMEIGDEG